MLGNLSLPHIGIPFSYTRTHKILKFRANHPLWKTNSINFLKFVKWLIRSLIMENYNYNFQSER